jgi:hypothetical protein
VIHERGFAVVHVGDDGDISDFFPLVHWFPFWPYQSQKRPGPIGRGIF